MNITAEYKDLPIGCVGDVHGDWRTLRDLIKLYQISDTILFQAGDFGVGFNFNNPVEVKKESKRLQELNVFFKKNKIYFYVVRGNHDNPLFFDGKHNLSNLIFMQDYDVVRVGKNLILGMGGAISIDKKPNSLIRDYRGYPYLGRKEGVSWWSNEKFKYNKKKIGEIEGVNLIVSHTAPDFAYPIYTQERVGVWVKNDSKLEGRLKKERALVTQAFKELKEKNPIKYWVYGHFHESKIEVIENTKFKLVDIKEFCEIKF